MLLADPAVGADFLGRGQRDLGRRRGQSGNGVEQNLPLALKTRQVPTSGVYRAPGHRPVDKSPAIGGDRLQDSVILVVESHGHAVPPSVTINQGPRVKRASSEEVTGRPRNSLAL
jgi:hypothetical protein